MPRLRELFPALAADARLPVPWDEEASIDADTGLATATEILETWVESTPDPDTLHQLAGLLHRDLVAMKRSASPRARHIVDLIQFRLATFAAERFTAAGAAQRVYDWLVRSLVDDEAVSGTLEFFLPRIGQFLASPEPLVSQASTHVVLSWCVSYFYYSRNHRVLGDLLADAPWLLDLLERFLVKNLPQALLSLLQYLEWTVVFTPTRTERILRLVEDLYQRMPFDRNGNKNLAMALALTAARNPRRNGSEIAGRVLRDFADLLVLHEPLQLRSRMHAGDATGLHGSLHLLVDDVRRFNQLLAGRSLPDQRHVVSDMRSRVFGILGPLLVTLLRAGHCRDTQALLAAWRDIPIEGARNDPGLVLCLIHPGGCLAAIEGASSWPHEAATSDAAGLVRELNAFLGTTVVFTDDARFELVAPPRGHGVPDQSAAGAFSAALLRELDVARIAQLVARTGEARVSCITLLPGGQWPIQALLLRELGWTRPLARSLEAPARDRPLRDALLVVAGTYQAEAERDAVRSILESAGIAVSVLEGEGATSQAVLAAYSSDVHDLIWIISHGEFSHFDAHTGGIAVAGGYLSYGDVRAAAVPTAGRRLLVLNLCDGGAAGWRGLHEVGVGVAACTAHQAVITHLWPVDPLITAVMGALLAGELARSGWFAAFERALRIVLGGKDVMMERLRELCGDGELARRFANTSVDPADFQHWASPVFLE